MTVQQSKSNVFAHLKALLVDYAPQLLCTQDDAENYSLNTHHIMKNKQPLFFGAVQIKKRYVSYHLMPVYVYPALLDTLSPELKARMQGKSCFNFTRVDDALFQQLGVLTKAGFERYRAEGFV